MDAKMEVRQLGTQWSRSLYYDFFRARNYTAKPPRREAQRAKATLAGAKPQRREAQRANPTLAAPSSLSITVAGALAAFIAIALLTAVAFLFQSDGVPLAQWAAAERACARFVYVSEREICMRQWIAAASAPNVASK